jgi:carbohydrate kinase (thermoresistant glucokinase family)
VGRELAGLLGLPFYDADNFHPASNVAKMTAGIPLTDDDRMPWLRSLSEKIGEWERAGGGVLACSALKERYRRVLADTMTDRIRFVHLQGTKEQIVERLKARTDHYMPVALLDSQFAELEPPVDAVVESINDPPRIIAQMIAGRLRRNP